MTRFVLILVVLSGCGGGFSDADSKAATNAATDSAMALALCAPDAGMCNAAQVRALERAALCANESMLVRHGEPAVDAGVACQK